MAQFQARYGKRAVALTLVCCTLAHILHTEAAPFLVVFGDSLSDTGRYSNGPVWVDHLAGPTPSTDPRIPGSVINYAIGGATACPGPAVMANAVSLTDQIARFASAKAPWKDQALSSNPAAEAALQAMLTRNLTDARTGRTVAPTGNIVVVIGGNDYLRALLTSLATQQDLSELLQTLPAQVVNCTMAAVRQLVALVAPENSNTTRRDYRSTRPPVGPVQSIVVASVPPIEVTPVFSQVVPASVTAALQQAMQRHNSLLSAAVRALAAERGPGVTAPRVTYFDLYTSILQIRNTAIGAGSMDVTDSCLNYALLFPVIKTMLTRVQSTGTNGTTTPATGPVLPPQSQGRTGGTARRLRMGLKKRVSPTDHTLVPTDTAATTPTATNAATGAAAAAPAVAVLSGPPVAAAAGPAAAPAPIAAPPGAGLAAGLSAVAASGTGSGTANLFFNAVSSVCTNPDAFLFYDAVHPTSGAHRSAAAAMYGGLAEAQRGR